MAEAGAIQRIARHHPRSEQLIGSGVLNGQFAPADAQLVIAGEHGFDSWGKFAKHVEEPRRTNSPVWNFETGSRSAWPGALLAYFPVQNERHRLLARAALWGFAAETRLDDMIRRVSVFCGSSFGARPDYAIAAQDLGRELSRHGIQLVYGGSKAGLMGVLADACLSQGVPVTGVIPQALVEKEIAHRGLTELRIVASMHERQGGHGRSCRRVYGAQYGVKDQRTIGFRNLCCIGRMRDRAAPER